MKRKVLKTLPARTYTALHRLSATVKLHGLSCYDAIVTADIRQIVEACPAKDDFVGWPDKKLSRWFFDHFLRVRARTNTSTKRRDELILANAKLARLEEESLRIQRDNLYQQALQQASMMGMLTQQVLLSHNAQCMEKLMNSGYVRFETPDQELIQPGVINPDSNTCARVRELGETKDPSSGS